MQNTNTNINNIPNDLLNIISSFGEKAMDMTIIMNQTLNMKISYIHHKYRLNTNNMHTGINTTQWINTIDMLYRYIVLINNGFVEEFVLKLGYVYLEYSDDFNFEQDVGPTLRNTLELLGGLTY